MLTHNVKQAAYGFEVNIVNQTNRIICLHYIMFLVPQSSCQLFDVLIHCITYKHKLDLKHTYFIVFKTLSDLHYIHYFLFVYSIWHITFLNISKFLFIVNISDIC